MRTVCQTCMHHCQLDVGQQGICGARMNQDGRIVCKNYGQVTALALDPIEKKPLRLFEPGSMILSAGSYGCNLSCPFCQNHEISMAHRIGQTQSAIHQNGATLGKELVPAVYLSPEELAKKAEAYRDCGNIGVAFTYNEPLVGWEYVRDTAKLVKKYGMKNVLVTNGTASLEVLEELLPYIDAMNIDLKGFRDSYYQSLGGSLLAVKQFIVRAAAECHVELTTLIVPGENDDTAEMEEEAKWIASIPSAVTADGNQTGQYIPLHVTRFFPRYHMTNKSPTDVQQIYRLANVAGKYLMHVFVGNCP